MFRIGYKASAEQFRADELLRFALRAEEVGFDSVGVSDHFQPLPGEQKVGVHDPREMERLAGALTSRQTASRWIVSADPDDVTERIDAYVAMGFNHLLIHGPGQDQQRFIQLFAKEVMPRLRARCA